MYVLVISKKKKNTILLVAGIVFIFFGVCMLIGFFTSGSGINIGYRLSFMVPPSVEIASVYAAEPDGHYIETGALFGNRLKTETIKHNGLSEITFQYPEVLRMGEIQNLGHEITVHVGFKHNNGKMLGFFQVWNLSQPFNEFIENAKKLSSLTFTNFNESRLKIQGMNGILWEYVYITRTQDVKGLEIFINNGSEMYRFSMFMSERDYKPSYKRILMRMAKSLRIKDTISATLLSVKKLYF